MAAVMSHELESVQTQSMVEVEVKMTKARAKALVRELLSAYAAKTFQSKLTEILSKEEEKGSVTDELPARWAWAEKFHNDILAQYGFETGNGMEALTFPLELILKSYPECMSNVQKISEYLKLKNWPAPAPTNSSTDSKAEDESAIVHADTAAAKPAALSKPRALALQAELLAILSTPSFQKKLGEMSRQRQPPHTFQDHNGATWKQLRDNKWDRGEVRSWGVRLGSRWSGINSKKSECEGFWFFSVH